MSSSKRGESENRSRRELFTDEDEDETDFSFPPKLVDGWNITDKYVVVRHIGKGVFGRVYHARTTDTGMDVALKVLRDSDIYVQQAAIEKAVLMRLRDEDIPVVQILDSFNFFGYPVFVFELLHETLSEHLNQLNRPQLSIPDIVLVIEQLLEVLCYCNLPNIKIIHSDLKLDNIMLTDPSSPSLKVKLIDFGSATFQSDQIHSYIQSRRYRAPEVYYRGKNYSSAVDMWSLGCIMYELFIGKPLFIAKTSESLFYEWVALLGHLPPYLVNKDDSLSSESGNDRNEHPRPRSTSVESESHSQASSRPGSRPGSRNETLDIDAGASIESASHTRPSSMARRVLSKYLPNNRKVAKRLSHLHRHRKPRLSQDRHHSHPYPHPHSSGSGGYGSEDYDLPDPLESALFDFIARCLTYDPDLRMTPEQARVHSMFSLVDIQARQSLNQSSASRPHSSLNSEPSTPTTASPSTPSTPTKSPDIFNPLAARNQIQVKDVCLTPEMSGKRPKSLLGFSLLPMSPVSPLKKKTKGRSTSIGAGSLAGGGRVKPEEDSDLVCGSPGKGTRSTFGALLPELHIRVRSLFG